MSGYGQFCAIARAHEAVGGRWTVLIVREILCGSHRFNDIRRGIPRISKSTLAERLRELCCIGVLARQEGPAGPEYSLTTAGEELIPIILALGRWGQRWLRREASEEDIDLPALLHDIQRRVRRTHLPAQPMVVRLMVGRQRPHFLLLRKSEVMLCRENPGFPEVVTLTSSPALLAGWWRGDITLVEAKRRGLRLGGERRRVREFPTWFERYVLADVAPAQ